MKIDEATHAIYIYSLVLMAFVKLALMISFLMFLGGFSKSGFVLLFSRCLLCMMMYKDELGKEEPTHPQRKHLKPFQSNIYYYIRFNYSSALEMKSIGTARRKKIYIFR